jgi:nitroimidazol reductase NimA-like FMN-containing flavoprotein (pyridoxamine 5'-phosphate oxidase superfamily)
MPAAQGSVALLDDPLAQDILRSNIPARFAYVWPDGTPRVVPVWYHWNGSEFVIATPPRAPKLKALRVNPKVALAIDNNTFPHTVLTVRGTAALEEVEGIVPEYRLAAYRYFSEAQANAWLEKVSQILTHMVRIRVRPEWVSLLDFQSRFPSALSH